MASSGGLNGNRSSERTPLLGSPESNKGTPAVDDEVTALGQGALEPGTFPELGKKRSYSHSHWLAPDEDANGRPEPEDIAQFQDDGLLGGISRTRFRFIYGGILLGYFVSYLGHDHVFVLIHAR
jgi:hypothetical protein